MIQNSSSAVLGNYTFRCADVKLFRPGVDVRVVQSPVAPLPTVLSASRFLPYLHHLLSPPPGHRLKPQKNGNGFLRLDPLVTSTVGPNVSAQLAALPSPGGSVTFNPSLASSLGGLDGANAVFLQWMANQGSFDVSVDFVNVPPALALAGDWTNIYSYVLNDLSYDCIISPVIVDAERTQSMTFLTPHQPYGYAVVAANAVAVPKTISQVLFSWTKPFRPSIWGCTAACLFFATLVMYLLEAKHNEDDFGLQEVRAAPGVPCLLYLPDMRLGNAACPAFRRPHDDSLLPHPPASRSSASLPASAAGCTAPSATSAPLGRSARSRPPGRRSPWLSPSL